MGFHSTGLVFLMTWAGLLEIDLSSVVRGRWAQVWAWVYLPEHLQCSDCVIAMVTAIVKDMVPHQYGIEAP